MVFLYRNPTPESSPVDTKAQNQQWLEIVKINRTGDVASQMTTSPINKIWDNIYECLYNKEGCEKPTPTVLVASSSIRNNSIGQLLFLTIIIYFIRIARNCR